MVFAFALQQETSTNGAEPKGPLSVKDKNSRSVNDVYLGDLWLLNIAQQLFLVLFSILYGVILQSTREWQPFPLSKTLRGYLNRHGETEIYFKDCGGIKSDKWLTCMWRKRAFWSIFILNFLPMMYFWLVLSLLDRIMFCHGFVPFWKDITLSMFQLFEIGVIFWCALGVFGFYRFYHMLVVIRWRDLFCDVVEEISKERKSSFDWQANFLWAICFYLCPGLSCLFLFNLDIDTHFVMLLWLSLNIMVFLVVMVFLRVKTINCITQKN